MLYANQRERNLIYSEPKKGATTENEEHNGYNKLSVKEWIHLNDEVEVNKKTRIANGISNFKKDERNKLL